MSRILEYIACAGIFALGMSTSRTVRRIRALRKEEQER